jgi:hypothetical protein
MAIFWVLFAAMSLAAAVGQAASEKSERVMSLAGEWRFIRGGPSTSDTMLPKLDFSDTINLPGTTDTNRKGPANEDRPLDNLSQPWNFQGTCWYQRDITIPQAWTGKRVTLILERTKFTQVFLDGELMGQNPIVCTSQEYELGSNLAPGLHKLTIAVDNNRLPPFGADSHQYSGNTQGNWNGIIGRIELQAHDAVSLGDVQVYPSAATRSIRVKVRLHGLAPAPGEGSLSLAVTGPGVSSNVSETKTIPWHDQIDYTVDLSLGPNAELWDEFHPVLQTLTVHLSGAGVEDTQVIKFGLRNFTTRDRQFNINGHTVFLRGKHDGCVFPLTGHPPMDVAGWVKYFTVLKNYGINHVRFHSWTPPDAAFTAADQMGFYLQPELPFWGSFDESVRAALQPEAERILRQYGNHPSFVMFSMGNENWGVAEVLDSLVGHLRDLDARHLYIRGTNAMSYRGPGPNDDYEVSASVRGHDGADIKIRGSFAGTFDGQGHVQNASPGTMTDYSQGVAANTVPSMGHEIGQFTVYPNYREIDKYTGVDRPYNLEHFRDDLARAGMADEDAAFAKASGALSALCYREDIETYLRTPKIAGFDLLDLQDFPGQGTALVGILDAFMDSKGILTPEQWRQFCSPVVLLAKFPKYVWTNDETFGASIETAQYGAEDIHSASLMWTLSDGAGHKLASGELPAVDLPRGGLRSVGDISIPLSSVKKAAQVRLDLSLVGTPIATSYPLWVYPAHVTLPNPTGVLVERSFNAAARDALAAGLKVLLVCDSGQPLARTVGGAFANDYWSFRFFYNKPGTVGLLCDPANPALAQFPTESHSNWQWFDIAWSSQPLVLDGVTPKTFRPILQAIDNCDRNHKLGAIFEAKVGPGNLLVCTPDLIKLSDDHPEARQLLRSLLTYVGSDKFSPTTAMSVDALKQLLRTVLPLDGCKATASSFDPSWKNYRPDNVIDGNESKDWRADPNATGDPWCEIAFPKPTDLNDGEIVWTDDLAGYKYLVEYTSDGNNWQTLSDQRANSFKGGRHDLTFAASGVTAVRITITGAPNGATTGIREVRFFAPEKP